MSERGIPRGAEPTPSGWKMDASKWVQTVGEDIVERTKSDASISCISPYLIEEPMPFHESKEVKPTPLFKKVKAV